MSEQGPNAELIERLRAGGWTYDEENDAFLREAAEALSQSDAKLKAVEALCETWTKFSQAETGVVDTGDMWRKSMAALCAKEIRAALNPTEVGTSEQTNS